MRLVIGSRKSDLARIQAYTVARQIHKVAPQVEISFKFKESLGDQNQEDPLWKMPQRGVFTEDFVADLESGQVDLVVHSWKDLPVEPRARTEIVATLPREDAHDLLLIKRSTDSAHLQIFSSSPRRAYNLGRHLPALLPFSVETIAFQNVRGNVPTRLRKLMESDQVHGLVVAKAALDRLLSAPEAEFGETQKALREVLQQCRVLVLPLSLNPCAPAQGALAIEVAKDRSETKELLRKVHCAQTFAAVSKEREILAQYGGGCHQKIGVYVGFYDFGEVRFVRGLTDAGEVLESRELNPETPGLPPIERSEAFPTEPKEGLWFERRPREANIPAQCPLFVARESAWPADFKQGDGQLVVTAGLKTWIKLAQKGVWVTACSEGMGENHLPNLQILMGTDQEIPFLRLTHLMADSRSSAANHLTSADDFSPGLAIPGGKITGAMATYELLPLNNTPKLEDKNHFYWMSGSSFLLALSRYPSIADKHHYSGPGKTAEVIRNTLKHHRGRHSVCLSYENWMERIKN